VEVECLVPDHSSVRQRRGEFKVLSYSTAHQQQGELKVLGYSTARNSGRVVPDRKFGLSGQLTAGTRERADKVIDAAEGAQICASSENEAAK
jgi:hypothetical protein